MDRFLTMLLAFLIALAPAAPGEGRAGHVHAPALAGALHDHAHEHGALPVGDAGVETPAGECSLVGGHCLAAMVAPIRDVAIIGYGVVIRSSVHAAGSRQGIVLTAEPPPPRA